MPLESLVRRVEDIIAAVQVYHPNANVGLIQKAYVYSAKVHAGQVRKSGEPYLIHPIEVSYLLARLRLDEASIATGLLHDTVEDTLATLEDIREMFGEEVSALVDGVTKLSQIRFDNSEHKQAENFRKMLVAMARDIRVILVKLCDRLHNMGTLTHLGPDKQRRIAQETMEIYAPLANRLGINWLKSELEDLAFQYLEPEESSALEQRVRSLTAERQVYVDDVVTLLRENLAERGTTCEVQGRPKHLYSIYKKMRSQHIEFEDVYDVVAFRVLTDSVGECYEVLGHVHSLWRPIPGRFKDYVAMPKPNNYQSLHTSVIGPAGERIEVQIRTHEMHKINEEGIAAHWEYKERSEMGDKHRKQFAWLRQLMEWQQDLKDPSEFLDTVKFDLFTEEVFVFTPRGEVISLRRGSTPVDFAYAIHTEVGDHCAGAKANGRMVPLRYELRNGDMVEIITSPQQQPSKAWLSFVRTGRAKTKIRAVVRGEERDRSRELGREMLEREMKRHGISLQKMIKGGQLKALAEDSRHQTVDGLFVALGYGRTTTRQILEALAPDHKPIKEPNAIEKVIRKVTGRVASSGVVVQGIEDVLVRYGKCCSPLPGEAIIGFVTRGRGITVHVRDCPRAIDADPERRIEVSWDADIKSPRPVTLRVATGDSPGILATISQTFTDASINIAQANCRVIDTNRAVNTFEVLVRDSQQLREVMGRIRQVNGVLAVDRI